MKHVKWSIVAIAATLSAAVFAQPTIDGTRDALYYNLIVEQNTQTGFGDSNLGHVAYANGSELDAAYAYVDMNNGILYLFLAGNLESNFNKLEIFFDTVAGGQNRLRGDNSNVDFGGLNRMGDDGSGNGLRFDSGFEADYWIGVTGGGSPYALYANWAQLLTLGGGPGYYLGTTGAASNGILSGGFNPPWYPRHHQQQQHGWRYGWHRHGTAGCWRDGHHRCRVSHPVRSDWHHGRHRD
jgi:hypothetical protein